MDALLPHDPRWVGPYRLEGRLGEGGMGQVFLGTSPGGRQVAVKLVRPELAATAQFRERFAREVDAARQVGGFHTAQVVDADPLAQSPWLVTAFIAGPTLHQVIAEHGALGADAASRLGAGIAEGLAAIHACGLVHRDLKPSNVIIADDGPRIIDFGIARAVDASSLTATGSVIGTYAYMSPEQIRADRAGPASDVFALGSVLAFAATGRGPFDAPTLLAVIQRILDEPPALAGLDGRLLGLLTECLAKDPDDRPAVHELPARFAAAVGGAAVHPPRPEPTVLSAPAQQGMPATAPVTAPAPGAGGRPYAPPGLGGFPAPAAPAEPRPGPDSATQTYAPARPSGPIAPATPEGPRVPGPGTGRRGPSRRSLLIGGITTAAAAAVGVPYLLLRKDGDTLEGPSSAYTVAFAKDGKTLAAAGGDGSVWRWSIPGRDSRTTRMGVAKYLQPYEFSRDLKALYRAEEHRVLRWDVASGRMVGTFTGLTTGKLQDGYIHDIGLSPDGRTLAASSARGLYLWNVASGSRLALRKDVKNGPATFSPDGKILATGSPVQLRRMPDDTLLATVKDSQGAGPLVFSPDGQVLALTDQSGRIRLWNTGSRQDVATLEGHDVEVRALAFDPSGMSLASGDNDGKALVWDTVSGTSTATFTGSSAIESLAFSPDGKSLAAGCNGGSSSGGNDTIRLWQLS